jgi:regulator of replication initiation timing
MSDPITLGLASTAVGLVNGTISLFKQAKEAAKNSDDHELKDKLSEVFDEILNLKEAVFNLAQENATLLGQLEQQKDVKWDTKSGFYYVASDLDPFCPTCWERDRKLIHLRPIYSYSSLFRHDCHVCKAIFGLKR